MPRDIHVDHDEIVKVTQQMNNLVDELRDAKTSIAKVVDNMVEEASVNTGNGQPAPVYGPILNAANLAAARIVMSIDAIIERLLNDLKTLNEASNATAETSEEMAAAMRNVDTSLGIGGGTGGGAGTGSAGVNSALDGADEFTNNNQSGDSTTGGTQSTTGDTSSGATQTNNQNSGTNDESAAEATQTNSTFSN